MITVEQVPGDHPDAVALVEAMVTGLNELYAGRTAPHVSATPEELSPPHGAYVLVREDGRAVAGGGVKRLGPGLGEVKRMYVVPEARSRGHARRLLEGLEVAAAERGYWRLRLDTGPEQPHAEALYRGAGYREIPDYNGNAYASYWAEKDLPAMVGARFNGPPGSGHGGYSSWVAARYVDAPAVEVTLRRPPPLDTPMEVRRDGETVHLADVLTAAPVDLSGVEAPASVDLDAARAARAPERWAEPDHPFPTCFACGPARDDGLHLYTGPLGDGRWAIDWDAEVDPAMVWAALDCPSCAPFLELSRHPIVLARFAVEMDGPPEPGPHAIVVEPVSREGRKCTSVLGLYDARGELRAKGRALWIELKPA